VEVVEVVEVFDVELEVVEVVDDEVVVVGVDEVEMVEDEVVDVVEVVVPSPLLQAERIRTAASSPLIIKPDNFLFICFPPNSFPCDIFNKDSVNSRLIKDQADFKVNSFLVYLMPFCIA
jgi:hypothetical protein